MLNFDEAKKVFEESFKNMPYEQISADEYGKIREQKELFFTDWDDTCPEKLHIGGFRSKYMEVTANEDVCFAIKYSSYLFDIHRKSQIEQIQCTISSFLEDKQYKRVSFYLFSEYCGAEFLGIFFGYATK